MSRYYSKTTHNEVFESSSDTIEYGAGNIDWWFKTLPSNYDVLYADGLPYKYKVGDFKKPKVDNGIVVEGITRAELESQTKAIKFEAWKTAKAKAEEAKLLAEFEAI